MYYNTTQETEIKEYLESNMKQDDKIALLFELSSKPMGASDLFKIMKNTPITSIRRSINTLMNNDVIVEDGRQWGMYGRKEYTYTSNND